ncbi:MULTISPECIES: hypothetical protein [Acidianus]|uniref:Polyketide cyclase n=1 Tax=Candidatus Acidianus copahuensis TaxID=1160895 RepID=A0A031LQ41_9CREN|nr:MULTISPECIES: hypothetical protein [Acidianus]EZQ04948.1 hypothetical protein CM19_07995 [Candidatus Acidianus copahuensis]NON61129.1 hypothetical protein [Acidianus sp. RZ1]
MVVFTVREKLVTNREDVLNRLMDVNSLPLYWKGTKSIQVIDKDNNKVDVKIRFAFPSTALATITIIGDGIRIDYKKGPFTGYQITRVKEGYIESMWDIQFTGFFKFLARKSVEHFKKGTQHALQRLQGIEPKETQ